MNKKYGAITSSTNPEEISTKVKGIIIALSSVIIFVATQFLHVTLSANDVISLASEAGTVAGAIVIVYGIGMHILSYFFKRGDPQIPTV